MQQVVQLLSTSVPIRSTIDFYLVSIGVTFMKV